VYSTTTTYLVSLLNSILLSPLKLKVFNVGVVVRVETSKLSDIASADPVPMLEVPNVPECSYILATAFPVGEPYLCIEKTTESK